MMKTIQMYKKKSNSSHRFGPFNGWTGVTEGFEVEPMPPLTSLSYRERKPCRFEYLRPDFVGQYLSHLHSSIDDAPAAVSLQETARIVLRPHCLCFTFYLNLSFAVPHSLLPSSLFFFGFLLLLEPKKLPPLSPQFPFVRFVRWLPSSFFLMINSFVAKQT